MPSIQPELFIPLICGTQCILGVQSRTLQGPEFKVVLTRYLIAGSEGDEHHSVSSVSTHGSVLELVFEAEP